MIILNKLLIYEGGKNILTIYLVITILISLSSLFSLRYCLKRFDKLELIGLFIYCSGLNQQFFYFFSSAFKFVHLLEEHLPLWIIRMDYSIISPSLLVWAMYFIVKTKSLWIKMLSCLIWSVIVTAIQLYEIDLGLLINKNWVLQHEIIKRLVIVALVYIFMVFWHKALKRDKVIA